MTLVGWVLFAELQHGRLSCDASRTHVLAAIDLSRVQLGWGEEGDLGSREQRERGVGRE